MEYDGDGSGRPTHKDITLTGMAAVHRQRVGELEPWSDDRRTLCQAGDGDYYYGGSKVASRPQLGGKTLFAMTMLFLGDHTLNMNVDVDYMVNKPFSDIRSVRYSSFKRVCMRNI